jgi:hypothetical protein
MVRDVNVVGLNRIFGSDRSLMYYPGIWNMTIRTCVSGRRVPRRDQQASALLEAIERELATVLSLV